MIEKREPSQLGESNRVDSAKSTSSVDRLVDGYVNRAQAGGHEHGETGTDIV